MTKAPSTTVGNGEVAQAASPTPAVDDAASAQLRDISTAELRAELERRQQQLAGLQRKRDGLRQQLAAVEREIRIIEHPGSGRAGISTRMVNPDAADTIPVTRRWEAFDTLPLAEAIARLMAIGDVISPQDATEHLIENGYGTRIKNLRTRVSQVLAKESRFRRVSRGRYERCA